MRFLLHPNFIMGLVGAGIFLLYREAYAAGVVCYLVALGLWVAAGRPKLLGGGRRKPARAEAATVEVTAPPQARSDGRGGAFSRIDPAWRAWLARQAEDSRSAGPTN